VGENKCSVRLLLYFIIVWCSVFCDLTWWDCVKNGMESLGLSQKDAQSRNKWRRRIKGQLANPGSPGKMAVKMECVCSVFCSSWKVVVTVC